MGNLFSKEPEINIIIGPMLSGKTTEMIRIINRLRTLNLKVLVINYEEDKRYSYTHMCTHDKLSTESEFIKDLKTVNYSNYDVICINEGQFFTGLVDFCKEVIKNNKSVYVAALDGDYKQEKFGEVLDLIPLCNNITKLTAFCTVCNDGTRACFTKRLVDSKEQKLIGTEEYTAVCRKHL